MCDVPESLHGAARGRVRWKAEMIGYNYLSRQAKMLLRLANSVKSPDLAAELVAKAADLEERAVEAPGERPPIAPILTDPPHGTMDGSPS